MITHSEKRLEHVASLLTQTENTDFGGVALLYGSGWPGRPARKRGMRERKVQNPGRPENMTSARKLVLDVGIFRRLNEIWLYKRWGSKNVDCIIV